MFGSDRLATSPYYPFLARLTAVTAGTGSQAGLWKYSWQEEGFTSAGIPNDLNPGRNGTTISSYAFEVNNEKLTVPSVAAPSGLSATLAAGGSLTSGTTYYYVVTATTYAGETTASSEVSATPSGGNLTVSLSWTAATAATGYKVYRGTSAGGENLLVGTITSGSTVTFSDTGIAGSSATVPTSNTTGPLVWVRLKGVVGGVPVYEFVSPGGTVGNRTTGGPTVNLVTKVCPTFGSGSGAGFVTGVTVEFTPITLPPGSTIGTAFCSTNLSNCCSSGSGSGSGGGTTTVSCCPNALPTTLHLSYGSITGPCSSSYGLPTTIPLTWNGSGWVSPAYPCPVGSGTFLTFALTCFGGGIGWRLSTVAGAIATGLTNNCATPTWSATSLDISSVCTGCSTTTMNTITITS